MISSKVRTTLTMLLLIVVITACGLPTANDAPADEAAATEAPAGDAAATEAPAGDAPATESAPPTEIPAIQHTDIPVNFPEKQSGEAGDFNSSKILENKTPIGGDRFTYGRFERPFNANAMDTYFPELDLVNSWIFQDDLWIYGRILLVDLSNGNAQYAVEIDTDLNGKADWLVIVDKPTSTDWTVSGVRVYQDTNKNIGGEFPALTDEKPVNSDGFETVFFDQGTGENSDTAWVRISPNDPNMIEFAINRAALKETSKYLINFWAARSIDPAKFDLNDAYTHEQAGAADSGLANFYPIKEVAEIDNTCRMAIGFQPTGKEPGLCILPTRDVQLDPPPGSGNPPGLSCPVRYSLKCDANGMNCFCEEDLR